MSEPCLNPQRYIVISIDKVNRILKFVVLSASSKCFFVGKKRTHEHSKEVPYE
jgi:hypothetical protein